MAKIFSILTLLIAAGAAYLGLESHKLVQELQKKGQENYDGWQRTKSKLADTEKKLKETETELATTKTTLEETRGKLATAEENLTKAKADLTAAQTKQAEAETALTKMREDLAKALPPGIDISDLPKLAQAITDMTSKVKDYEAKIADQEKKVAELNTVVETQNVRIKEYEDQDVVQKGKLDKYEKGIVAKGLRGKVLAVNAGWGFCVISMGDKQGAAANKTLVVARDGRAIGKVKITNVEATQSIADILPGTFARNTFVQPGDTVVYTGEEKTTVDEITPPLPVR